jgi:N-acetylglucosamine-6-phosphate deacetylase
MMILVKPKFLRLALVSLITLACTNILFAQDSTSKHVEGLNESKPSLFVLSGATIHVSPDKTIENGTLVVRGQKIIGVGDADLETPVGARVVDLKGKHIYAGFMDSYVPVEVQLPEGQGTSYWNDRVTPQLNVAASFSNENLNAEDFRIAGITTALVVPQNGIIKGTSSVLLMSDSDEENKVLNPLVAQHLRLTVSRGFGSGYPSSPMGAVALARQALYDAQWYAKANKVAKTDPAVQLPEFNASLSALGPVIDADVPVMVDTSNELFVLRADRFAREFGLRLVIKGSGNEYRRLKEIAALGKPVILPLKYPTAPDVSDPTAALDVSLETLMHWDHAPENAGRLANAGVTLAMTSDGLDEPEELLEHLQIAVKRGLDEQVALASITQTPAKLFGVEDQIGSLEKGKLASLVVMDKPLFENKSKVLETWVAGSRFRHDRKSLRSMAGKWTLDSDIEAISGQTISITGNEKLSAKIEIAENEEKNKDDEDDQTGNIEISSLNRSGTRLSGVFDGADLGVDGVHRFSLLFVDEENAQGQLVSSTGAVTQLSATRTGDEEKSPESADKKKSSKGHAHDSKMASFPVNYPLGAYGKTQAPEADDNTLITNVTIWTNSERGILKNGAVLINEGKIKGVFSGEDELPSVDKVIDGSGMHLTPGIIDCHSHMATDSGVNEGSQAVTAEVRIGDMVDCDDINIYRQLAGGVTMVNILHGSANPIGGQNQVIKLHWGANDEEMKFAEAPAGIKFALGENVKRSRSPESTRYPKTRMGVEQIMEDRFRAAEEYRDRWARYSANPSGLPPRVDLELQTIAEIVKGERWIHCHSYRQDEILALIRVLDNHGITIGSFQHILEGYKVADAMAKHGAMASSFSDWWAYKFEVYDATPYGGALMHNAGVVVSFNSDDRELARHLNHEAAKAVKYGGVSEEEALKFVTLNPAKQLRIDQYVGSIEAGKHADLALWSGPPLNPQSRCEKTWVDGVCHFDFEKAMFDADAFASMRNQLVQKILASGQKMKKQSKGDMDPAGLWPRYDEFCHEHDHDDGH